MQSRVQQAFHVVRYPHSLRWLYLLVLVAALPSNPHQLIAAPHPSHNNRGSPLNTHPLLPFYISRFVASIDIWFIKWFFYCYLFIYLWIFWFASILFCSIRVQHSQQSKKIYSGGKIWATNKIIVYTCQIQFFLVVLR